MKTYQKIAFTIQAIENCLKANNKEWFAKHHETLDRIEKDCLPSGSGIDSGTTIDRDKSNPELIVLNTSFHHMNDAGMYDRWTEHTVRIKPSFFEFTITITGRDRNDIKDYLGDEFHFALSEECDV